MEEQVSDISHTIIWQGDVQVGAQMHASCRVRSPRSKNPCLTEGYKCHSADGNVLLHPLHA